MSEAVDNGPSKRRPAPFVWGFAVGFGSLLIAGLGVWWIVSASDRSPPFAVEVISNGSDVTRHGGMKVQVQNDRGALTQTCRGRCDDLRVRYRTGGGDNVFAVRVLDSQGKDLTPPDPGRYVSSIYGGRGDRWVIEGQDVLRMRTAFVERQADGSLQETHAELSPPLKDR